MVLHAQRRFLLLCSLDPLYFNARLLARHLPVKRRRRRLFRYAGNITVAGVICLAGNGGGCCSRTRLNRFTHSRAQSGRRKSRNKAAS
jgi:hypothetical protein